MEGISFTARIHNKELNNMKLLAKNSSSETETCVWSGVFGPTQRRSGKRFKWGAEESS